MWVRVCHDLDRPQALSQRSYISFTNIYTLNDTRKEALPINLVSLAEINDMTKTQRGWSSSHDTYVKLRHDIHVLELVEDAAYSTDSKEQIMFVDHNGDKWVWAVFLAQLASTAWSCKWYVVPPVWFGPGRDDMTPDDMDMALKVAQEYVEARS